MFEDLQEGGRMPPTVSDLVVVHYSSPRFGMLSRRTQRIYANILERLCAEHGSVPVAEFSRRDVLAVFAARVDTPSAANRLLSLLRVLMHLAVCLEWRGDDPTAGVRPLRTPKRFVQPCWSEHDRHLFEARHPPGSIARRAFSLMLYAELRPSGAVAIGPRHVDGDRILVRRGPGGARAWLPLHPALRAELDLAPSDAATFLCDSRGSPLSAAALGRCFRRWCDEAGLSHCKADGLRRATVCRLAEVGCDVHWIEALMRHRPIMWTQYYLNPIYRARLAEQRPRKHPR